MVRATLKIGRLSLESDLLELRGCAVWCAGSLPRALHVGSARLRAWPVSLHHVAVVVTGFWLSSEHFESQSPSACKIR